MGGQVIDFDNFVNCAQLFNPHIGGAETDAEKLRREILSTDNTEKYYEITGTKYYISENGNDINDGLSPKTAFRTASKLDEIELNKGDGVLFERNGTFRLKNQITTVEGVTYGSYGTGSKPQILGSPKNYAKEAKWLPAVGKNNVWWTAFPYHEAYNIVFENGKKVGIVKTGKDTWCKEYQYAHDTINGVLYLYSEKGNPSQVYDDIEICPSNAAFEVPFDVSGVTVDNLCIKYFALSGVNCAARNNDINVTNCEIGFIGGILAKSLGVRMGNAVGTWISNINLRVDHNWIYQTYDTAISPQGRDGLEYRHISFCDNLLEYNSVDFEWFDKDNAVFDDFKCNGNIMRFTCLGWGNLGDGVEIRGIEGCIRAVTDKVSFTNFSFKNNIIDCPAKQIINWQLTPEQLSEFEIKNNKLFFNEAYRKIYDDSPILMRLPIPDGFNGNIETDKYVRVYAESYEELQNIWKLWNSNQSDEIVWI